MGRHGLTAYGERIATQSPRKFIFWGDSYADAVQIPQEKRAMSLFNSMAAGIQGFTVAGGGRGCADYLFNIPLYEKAFEGIEGHVILLTDLEDITPGKQVPGHSLFLLNPLRFENVPRKPSRMALDWAFIVHQLKADFLHEPYKTIKNHRWQLFSNSPQRQSTKPLKLSQKTLTKAWEYLLSCFKKQTQGFVVFVYVPSGPGLVNGEVILADSKFALKEKFRLACAKEGVGFVDLSQSFVSLYTKQGRLPRGFFNTPQGSGHLNEDGQRIIAEELRAFFDREGL